MVGESQLNRIRAREASPGEPGVGAQLSRRTGEKVGSADIGHESDTHLGHTDLRALGDHPHRPVSGDPHSATEHDAVHDRDVRLRVFGDRKIEGVLVSPEGCRILHVLADRPVERDDVAAGAQAAIAGTVDQHSLHVGIISPRVKLLGQRRDHAERERVDGPGAIEEHQAEPSIAGEQDLGRGLGFVVAIRHEGAPASDRPMMSRMISFVPSRIWCTRRSRTIRSIPYSDR